eukprot:1149801-Pelagomonas_calceolata.AAC.8
MRVGLQPRRQKRAIVFKTRTCNVDKPTPGLMETLQRTGVGSARRQLFMSHALPCQLMRYALAIDETCDDS